MTSSPVLFRTRSISLAVEFSFVLVSNDCFTKSKPQTANPRHAISAFAVGNLATAYVYQMNFFKIPHGIDRSKIVLWTLKLQIRLFTQGNRSIYVIAIYFSNMVLDRAIRASKQTRLKLFNGGCVHRRILDRKDCGEAEIVAQRRHPI